MNRVVRFGVPLLAAWLVLLFAVPVLAAPTLAEITSQVVILEDGRLLVTYRLTFVDDASRTQITAMGPFDSGHSQVEAHLQSGDEQNSAKNVLPRAKLRPLSISLSSN